MQISFRLYGGLGNMGAFNLHSANPRFPILIHIMRPGICTVYGGGLAPHLKSLKLKNLTKQKSKVEK